MIKTIQQINQIIDRELTYWKEAYPECEEVLNKFAQKIKFELEMQ